MDYSNKYLYIKHDGKNVYEVVDEIMGKYKSPLYTIKKLREIFPALSLIEAKEIVIVGTTEYKNLYDYQGSLLPHLEKFLNKESESNDV